jgi:hypothetical protein
MAWACKVSERDPAGASPTSSRSPNESPGPFRYFVTRGQHPAGTALFRLGPRDVQDVWATVHMLESWGFIRGRIEGWRSTEWPPLSVITDSEKYIEVDAEEAERLKQLLASSPTFLDTSPLELTADGSIPDWDNRWSKRD